MKWVDLDFRVAPLWPVKALRKTKSTVHAYIMIADLSGSIDNIDSEKKALYCFHANQLPLRVHDFFFPILPY